jgi:hypothetical protein
MFSFRETTDNSIFRKSLNLFSNDNQITFESILSTIDVVEELVQQIAADSDQFGITPTFGFQSVTVQPLRGQMIARRAYYALGFVNNDQGTCDCETLRKMYQTHPLLKEFIFEEEEPQCCD